MRAMREQRGWTLEDIGRMLDTDRFHMSKIELGNIQPSSDTVARLADIFETTTDYLLGRDDGGDLLNLTPGEQAVIDALRKEDFPRLFRLLGQDEQKPNK